MVELFKGQEEKKWARQKQSSSVNICANGKRHCGMRRREEGVSSNSSNSSSRVPAAAAASHRSKGWQRRRNSSHIGLETRMTKCERENIKDRVMKIKNRKKIKKKKSLSGGNPLQRPRTNKEIFLYTCIPVTIIYTSYIMSHLFRLDWRTYFLFIYLFFIVTLLFSFNLNLSIYLFLF